MISKSFSLECKSRILLGLVLLFVFFSLFFNLGGRSLENQDNLRFAEIGREILETGDWVMMRMGGGIYVEKPPLHFWNIALSYLLFGVGTFAARFPSALFAALGVLGILLFTLFIDKENPKIAVYACFFLISNYAFTYYSRTARMDIEYSVLFSLSLMFFYIGWASDGGKRKALFYTLFWILMGMAFLVKGPTAFMPLLIVLVFLLVRRDRKRLQFRILALSAVALLFTVLPWVVLLVKHNDFARYLDLLKTTKIMTRRAEFFYYFPSLFINFFPGSIFMAISIPFLWRRKEEFRNQPGLVFCLIWFAVYFLSIHLTVAKNLRYLLPVFPPLSVITAWATERMFRTSILHSPKRYWKIFAGAMVCFACFAPAAWILIYRGFMWNALLFPIAGVVFSLLLWKRSRDAMVFICVLCILSFLAMDLVRTSFNTVVSKNLRLYNILKAHDIRADDALLYKTDPELKMTLSFYFNKLLRQKDDMLGREDKAKAVVTTPSAVGEVLKVYGTDRRALFIESQSSKKPDFWVVFPLLQ